MDKINTKTITFQTGDGWELVGDLTAGQTPTTAILISAGTGFPRQFYSAFANYLALQGAIVLTFDYRGIGGSAANDLATAGIEYTDWAKDQAAAIDMLSKEAQGLRITHIGHSVGGHFLGFVKNHHKIHKHAFISVGTGYFGGHKLSNLPTEFYFWWILGSFSLARWGYIKPVGGWKGAALPPSVFKTWRRWSHKRHYFQTELGKRLEPDHFSDVTAAIRSWIFSDDPIATLRSGNDLLKCYPNAPQEIILRTPKEVGVKRIGHEGAFRAGREKLWQEIWDWLNT